MTLVERLAEVAAATPGRVAFVCGADAVRYDALRARVDDLAGWLRRVHGLERGGRVLLAASNSIAFVVAVYAVWRAGAVVVPVNPASAADELDYVARDSGAGAALVDGHAASMPASLRVVALGDALAAAAAARIAPGADAVAADDWCVLPYTSGTTGRPKGCVHTQATLLASLRSSARWRGFDADTVFMGNTPLFHMQGFQNGIHLPVLLGATSVLQPRWQPDEAAALIERHRVTAWSAAPTMLIDLFASPAALARDLSSLRLVAGGGAALPGPIATALAERFGLRYNEAYGMTETASFLIGNPVGGGKAGSLGVAPPGVATRIVEPGTGSDVPDGELGELVVAAPQLLVRYRDEGLQPHANDGAFVVIDGLRHLRTGDLVVRDDDGYHFIRDRLKRMINSAGFKVWPAEVEAVLHRHPAVQEACVIAMRDARRGEAVKAVVVRRAGSAVDGTALIAWARAAMAHYKAPRTVEFRDALPRSGTGKVAWRALQDEQRRADEAAA